MVNDLPSPAPALSTHSEVCALWFGELDVRTHHAIGFEMGHGNAAAVKQPGLLSDDAEDGQSKMLLDVFNPLDAGIKELDEKRQRHAQHQAAHATQDLLDVIAGLT